MDTTNIVIQAGAVTTFVKVLIDILKISPIPASGAVLPLLAVPTAFGITLLLDVAQGTALTGQVYAIAALVAILSAGGAVGVTELQKKSDEK